MKKIVLIFIAFFLCISFFGCNSSSNNSDDNNQKYDYSIENFNQLIEMAETIDQVELIERYAYFIDHNYNYVEISHVSTTDSTKESHLFFEKAGEYGFQINCYRCIENNELFINYIVYFDKTIQKNITSEFIIDQQPNDYEFNLSKKIYLITDDLVGDFEVSLIDDAIQLDYGDEDYHYTIQLFDDLIKYSFVNKTNNEIVERSYQFLSLSEDDLADIQNLFQEPDYQKIVEYMNLQ